MDVNEKYAAPKTKIAELQAIIAKMPLELCCVSVLPEFGLRWREVSRAIRNARLPMSPASVARVICRAAARLPAEEFDQVIPRLRLYLVTTQSRTWHVIRLRERVSEDPVALLTRCLPSRIRHVLENGRRNLTPEVDTVMLGDLLYVSVRLVSAARAGSPVYVATPPGQDVAVVSTLGSTTLLRAVVQGLGFKEYESINLHGRDINSLLRISDDNHNEQVDHLKEAPEYNPMPVVTRHGIDYTNKSYDDKYVESILGPDPPLLTDLTINSAKPFFDSSKLDKQIALKVQLKSENVAGSLKAWVAKGALAPTSDFFQIFHKIKSNRITYNAD